MCKPLVEFWRLENGSLILPRSLVDTPYPDEMQSFMEQNGIRNYRLVLPANKVGVAMNQCQMSAVLRIVLDHENYPLLIHCNKGKVGRSIGCT